MATTETVFRIKVDDKTRAALNRISKNYKKMGNDVQKIGRGISKQITAPVIAAGIALGALSKQAVSSADKMKKLSTRLGVSTKALSEYKFVASQSGVEFNTLTMAWQRMSRRVAEAAKGTGEAKNALYELNVDAKQLNRLSPDKQFEILADALEGVSSQSDKVRLSMKLFDSEGVSLLQTMAGGSEAMRIQADLAKKLGIVIDDDLASKAEDLTNKFGILKSQILGVGISIARHTMPAMNQFADSMAGVLDNVKQMNPATLKTLAIFAGIAASIGPILIGFGALTKAVGVAITGYKNMLPILKAVKVALMGVSSTVLIWAAIIAAALLVGVQLWANWGDKIKEFVGSAWIWVIEKSKAFGTWFMDTTRALVEKIQGLWSWLSDGIEKVMKTVFNWLGDAFNSVVRKTTKSMSSLIGWIETATRKLGSLTGNDELIGMANKLAEIGKGINDFGEDFNIQDKIKAQVDKIDDVLGKGINWFEELDFTAMKNKTGDFLGNQLILFKGQISDMKKSMSELLGFSGYGPSMSNSTPDSTSTVSNVEAHQEELSWLAQMGISWDEIALKMNNVKSIGDGINQSFVNMSNGVTNVLGDAFGQLVNSMLTTGKQTIMLGRMFRSMFVGIMSQLGALIARLIIVRTLMAFIPGLGAATGGIGLAIKNWGGIAGEKAEGGPVGMGQTYLVGERGPELFTPTNGGSITPNNQLGGNTIYNSITVKADGNIFSDPLALRRVAEVLNDEMDKVQNTYFATA